MVNWLVGWFREKFSEHAKIRSVAQAAGPVVRTRKFQLKVPTPTPGSLLFTWRHLKVRVVLFSCELFTSTRIIGIKEVCVCVSPWGSCYQSLFWVYPRASVFSQRFGRTAVVVGIFYQGPWLLLWSTGTLKSVICVAGSLNSYNPRLPISYPI